VTSSEWPHAAAIERERRQRAARAFQLMLQGGASKPTSESTVNCVTGSNATRLSPSPVSNIPVCRLQQQQQQQYAEDRRRVRIQSEPQTAVGPSASTALLADGKQCNSVTRLKSNRRSVIESRLRSVPLL
jgi:hypothetical protein